MAISLQQYHAPPYETYGASELRLLYQLYEEAQRSRIAHGERLRAIFQGRAFSSLAQTDGDSDDLLKAIKRGESAGAPRLLERAYARATDDEAAAAVELRDVIEQHPAWPWLDGVKGIGHLLAARLLSRLDVTRAKTPSSFWAYCGLGTIPGVAYRCSLCGLESAYPVGYQAREKHYNRSGSRECAGVLQQVDDDASARVAPRRSVLGGRASYDAQARNSCYLIGVSMLRCGGDYRSYYDAERAKLASSRPGWTPRRCHLAALRKMEKAFLRDLWVAWRRAVNLPVVAPYFPHP
ncbi:MAG: transposase [Gemmatimonadota bacterium]|nr:transposase [Gemmatimonadota bacterium]